MTPDSIQKCAVIGAGTMGSVIAGDLARIGCRVLLADRSGDIVERGLALLEETQAALINAGRLSEQDARSSRDRVLPAANMKDACDGAQLVIEAVSEDMRVKQDLFRELDRLCPEDTVMATNTSGLSITQIASATGRPEKIAGMHFWNPPHIIPLVEVTKGERTSDATADFLMGIARSIGKKPVLVRRDVPGFIGNRLQFAVLREALHLVSSGVASAEDVDTAMTAGPGLRYGLLGPLRTADLGGLDVFHAISSYLFAELSSSSEPPEALASLVEQGYLGAKTGRGFYEYPGSAASELAARRDRVLLGFLDVLAQGGSSGQ